MQSLLDSPFHQLFFFDNHAISVFWVLPLPSYKSATRVLCAKMMHIFDRLPLIAQDQLSTIGQERFEGFILAKINLKAKFKECFFQGLHFIQFRFILQAE